MGGGGRDSGHFSFLLPEGYGPRGWSFSPASELLPGEAAQGCKPRPAPRPRLNARVRLLGQRSEARERSWKAPPNTQRQMTHRTLRPPARGRPETVTGLSCRSSTRVFRERKAVPACSGQLARGLPKHSAGLAAWRGGKPSFQGFSGVSVLIGLPLLCRWEERGLICIAN